MSYRLILKNAVTTILYFELAKTEQKHEIQEIWTYFQDNLTLQEIEKT